MGWWGRLFGGTPAAVPRAMPAAQAPAASAAAAHPSAVPASFGVRRPLVGAGGAVAGFELLWPPALARRLEPAGNPVALAAHHAALLTAARPIAGGGRLALLHMPAAMLAHGSVAAATIKGCLLHIGDLRMLPSADAALLRGRGAMLGVSDGPPAAAPPTDFVCLRAIDGDTETLLLSAQRWQEARTGVRLVSIGPARLDQVERLLGAGFWLVGGDLARSAVPSRSAPLGAAAHRICELLNHLALDHELSVLAGAVRADVALSLKLLRYANSPAIGLTRGVESVDQAVMVLGRAELRRWLSVALLAAAESRPALRALQEAALARGRLLETLARDQGDSDAGSHFTLGLLSLIEPLLQRPLAQALEPFRLGEATRQALLEQKGPLAPRLALLTAIDAGDADEALHLAGSWGQAEALPAATEAAWAWAEEVTRLAVR